MNKKRLGVAVLVLVILASVVFIVKSNSLGKPKPPPSVLARSEEMIDKDSLEVITRTVGEWEHLGHNSQGLYLNPNTKKYSMKDVVVCPFCGAKAPAESSDSGSSVRCPKCGKIIPH